VLIIFALQIVKNILFQQMGIVDTFRFLNQFTLGRGDYTQERKQWLDNFTLEEIVSDIKARRKSNHF